jgi:D-alanyl-D-alanine carboxypeptidase
MMLRLKVIFLLSLMVFLGTACERSPDLGPGAEDRIKAMLDEEWALFQEKHSFEGGGLGIKLITPDGDLFASAVLGEEVDENIHFRAASTTKTFTAAAIMLMHQKGLLDIDDYVTDNIPNTIRPYLPDTPEYQVPHKDNITIRQLLEHRAGVFDVSNDPVPAEVDAPYAGMHYIDYIKYELGREDHTFTYDELVGVAARHGLSYWKPGTGFHYSNTGYSMLGKIIERVSEMDYDSYVEQTFAQPLGLDNTKFPSHGSEKQLPTPYAPGITLVQGQIYETTTDNMSPHVAEGNVITTPGDLARWINYLISGKAGLVQETVELMIDVQPTHEYHEVYGLGITMTEGLGYGHNGGHAGYLTVMRHNPEDEVSVVLFASALVADDLLDQLDFMVEVARKARGLAGYTGQEN